MDSMNAVRRFSADPIISSPPEKSPPRPPEKLSRIHPMGEERHFDPDDVVAVAAVSRQRPGIDHHLDTIQAYPPPPTPPTTSSSYQLSFLLPIQRIRRHQRRRFRRQLPQGRPTRGGGGGRIRTSLGRTTELNPGTKTVIRVTQLI